MIPTDFMLISVSDLQALGAVITGGLFALGSFVTAVSIALKLRAQSKRLDRHSARINDVTSTVSHLVNGKEESHG